MNLTLEINERSPEVISLAKQCNLIAPTGSVLAVTPPIEEDFWILRVKVSEKQAVVAFPKFFTVGIGFQVEEEDPNTNLPYTSDPLHLYRHIQINKGHEAKEEDCIAAIKMLQAGIAKLKGEDGSPSSLA